MSNTVTTYYTGSSQMSFTVSGSKKEEKIRRQHKVQWNQVGIQYRAENKCIENFSQKS